MCCNKSSGHHPTTSKGIKKMENVVDRLFEPQVSPGYILDKLLHRTEAIFKETRKAKLFVILYSPKLWYL